MKTFTKIAAAVLLFTSILPAVFAPSANAAVKKTVTITKTMTKMGGHKGGYVHATTYVTKKGTVVHRKGYYRHSTKMTGMMAPKKMIMKMTTKKVK